MRHICGTGSTASPHPCLGQRVSGYRNVSIVDLQEQIGLHLKHFRKGPQFHVEEAGFNLPGPLAPCRTGGRRFDDEEGATSEDREGCLNSRVGVYKSPNPARETAIRCQRSVMRCTVELLELLHTGLMEKQGLVGADLQRGGKLKCETA